MGGDRGRRPGDPRRTAADHVSKRRQLRRVRRHGRRIAVLLDARRAGRAARTLVGGGRRIRRTGDAGAHRRRAAHAGGGDRLVRAPWLVAMAKRRNRWGQPGVGACLGGCLPAGPGSVADPERTVFGSPLPSAGGHTLWIRSYNEQFSIGHEVSLATYLDWGLPNIVLSKLNSWGELVGRTGVLLGGIFLIFFLAGLWIFRRRSELAPFYVYFAVMFFVMGALFTFHAPKGAFYHSAPAWLPWALGISAAAVGPALTAAGRVWPFLRRPATHRFVAVAGLGGAAVLSLIGSAILFQQWDRSRVRDEQVAAFLRTNAGAG